MSLTTSLISKARNAATVRNLAKKVFGPSRKVAQKVDIVSDSHLKIPGVLNLNTGTKTFRDIGAGIRVVQPGENTSLGKLGFTEVIKYPAGFFGGKSEPLLLFESKAMQGGKPSRSILMTPNEAKDYLAICRNLAKTAENNILKNFAKNWI